MLAADSKPITRKWAIALIIINLLSVASPFIAFYQTKYQLVSDLIPQGVVLEITSAFMLSGILCVLTTLTAFGFFVYSRFIYSIITVAAGLLITHILPYFIY